MARPRRPWIKVLIDILSHEKMASLPNDSARLGWFAVLLEAKTQRRMGVFGSQAHLRSVLGLYGKYVPNYIAQQLAHEAPLRCADCKKQYPDAKAGDVVVHDYRKEQRDPTHNDRQQVYDAKDDPGDDGGEPVDDRVSDAIEPPVSDAIPDGVSDAKPDGNLTADSRARGTTVTVTTTETGESPALDSHRATATRSNARAHANGNGHEPRLTKRELDSWDDFTAPEWQPFKSAWLKRGLHFAPFGDPDDDDTSQRGLLWQIADARPTDLARWVAAAPGHTAREVIDHVLEQWHDIRADAGVEDEAWQDEKAAERHAAATAMTGIKDLLR